MDDQNKPAAASLMEPCPCCGKQETVIIARSSDDENYDYSHDDYYAIFCDASRPDGPGGCGASGGFRATLDEAIEVWNRRPGAPKASAVPEGYARVGICIAKKAGDKIIVASAINEFWAERLVTALNAAAPQAEEAPALHPIITQAMVDRVVNKALAPEYMPDYECGKCGLTGLHACTGSPILSWTEEAAAAPTNCDCLRCIRERGDTIGGWLPRESGEFIACAICGNKRCPHTNDHRNACTNSNEPGQAGSAYPAAPTSRVHQSIDTSAFRMLLPVGFANGLNGADRWQELVAHIDAKLTQAYSKGKEDARNSN